MAASARTVGIVVIGRNEGERLRRCLESVAELGLPVVYVDSGSSDGSLELAGSFAARTVALPMPYTAARARNAGLELLRCWRPEVRFVQFVDADCELDQQWIPRGLSVLNDQQDVAVAFGHVHERSPEASVYNRICNMEWVSPIGRVAGCGGIAMMRVDAFLDVGGFDPTVMAGEDTELCNRLRLKGHGILHVDADMVRHDAAMMRLGQWWRRALRAGYGAAYCAGLPDGRSVH
jgi:GT2 family glycosyltransferase